MKVRLIVDPPLEGPANMARDEALLISARAGTATVRLYSWAVPTLSLGYFQAYADRAVHPISQRCPVVRRHSGGGAILHDRELTYSVAMPLTDDERRSTHGLVTTVHESLAAVWREAGLDARLATGDEPSPPGPQEHGGRPFLCFQRRAEGDLLVGAYKVGGSAQRKWHGALLQHGSILLRRSVAAPELPGAEDLAGGEGLPEDWRTRWLTELANRLHWSFAPSTMTDEEFLQAHVAAESRFLRPEWTRRR